MINNSYGFYDSIKPNTDEQWIRISEGCPNQCPYCKEPREEKVFEIPTIRTNNVKIMDMNFLSKPNVVDRIKELGLKRVNNKVVYYELVCGIDYRFLTEEIAILLRENRFRRMRLAWDYHYGDMFKIKKAINKLNKAKYKNKELMIFMICNWRIPFTECMKKLNMCKYWNVKVADCYYDGQVMPDVKPINWSINEIKLFRHEVRKHNQTVLFGVDPEYKQETLKNEFTENQAFKPPKPTFSH